MTKEVAYVPIAPAPNEQVKAPEKIEEPQYPDKGVSYGGYSKTLFTGNQYRLDKQDAAYNGGAAVFAGGEAGATISHPGGGTKNFYCTNLVFMTQKAGVIANVDNITIRDGSLNKMILKELVINNTLLNFHFTVPLLFTKGNSLVINYTNARAAGDIVAINFYGWVED